MSCAPELSIVVIGLNEGERLERCLAAIQTIHFPKKKTELIYFDSGSTDGSVEKARRAGARVIVLMTDRPTAGLARNAGWRASRAPFVLFLDGDSMIHPDFVVQALKVFENDPKTAVLFGWVRELYPNVSFYHRALNLQWFNPSPGQAVFCAGNAFVRRSALERVGGYNSFLIGGEDLEISSRFRRLGYVIVRIDFPMVLHDLAMTRWRQYWRRCLKRGYYRAQVRRFLQGTNPYVEAELLRSRLFAPLIILAPLVSLYATLGLESVLPLAGTAVALLFLIVITTWIFRDKTEDKLTLLSFVVHFYIMTLPVFVGQLLYHYDRLFGCCTEIKRYK